MHIAQTKNSAYTVRQINR